MTGMLLSIIGTLLLSVPSSGVDKLWKSYEAAVHADKIEDQAAILSQIKTEALKGGLLWDYYDACEKYVDARVRKNWKLRAELGEKLEDEIRATGESVAWFHLKKEGLEYIRGHETQLRASAHKEFWEHDYRITSYSFSSALVDSFRNDWEYACFCLLGGNPELKGEFASGYPLEALSEFATIEEKDMAVFAAKYEGRAAGLLARARILQQRFYKEGADSKYYSELKTECEQFEKERKSFNSGIDKTIAESEKSVAALLEELESKDLRCWAEDGKVAVVFRNLASASVKLEKDGKSVWSASVRNDKGSLYALDTARVAIPDIPDGEYALECKSGNLASSATYNRFTISIALRRNAAGTGFYAADYISGEPLGKVTVELTDKYEKVIKVCEAALTEGFTDLPEEIAKAAEGLSGSSICVLSGTRRSKPARLDSHLRTTVDLSDSKDLHCILLSDRAAYNPDETLHFKAVIYEGKYSLRPVAGMDLKATAYDAEGNVIEEKKLRTGELGSAEGSFLLKRCKRGGTYNIIVENDKQVLGSKTVRVDDFILPTFDVVFDGMPDVLERPLTSIRFSGRAAAYSGHGLGNAKVIYTITSNGDTSEEKTLPLEYDGSFSIEVPVSQSESDPWYEYYLLSIKITDGTGETLEFSKGVSVRRKSEESEKPTDHYFEETGSENGVGLKIVSEQDRKTWAVAELYGCGNVLLEKKFLVFEGETSVSYVHKDSYPETISLNVIYFQDKKSYTKTVSHTRENHSLDLSLEFSRFLDTTLPGASYEFEMKTEPGVECAVSIFDKSTETVRPNEWNPIAAALYPKPSVRFTSAPGSNDSATHYGRLLTKSSANEAVPFQMVESKASFSADGADSAAEGVYLRENFANTVAWEPGLTSDGDGVIRVSFKNADKLSTYYVQAFAHDRSMRNAVLRKEMKITLPVKISLIEIPFVYAGDKMVVSAQLSNSLDRAVSGTVTFDGRTSVPVRVEAYGTAVAKYSIPTVSEGKVSLTAVFKADNQAFGSDGIKIVIPVSGASEKLSEAHSALLKAGEDKDALIEKLRSEFVNIPGVEASVRTVSIMDMIEDAVPEEVEPKSENTLDLAIAAKARRLLGMDRSELLEKIEKRRADNGGYPWMEGMSSSPVVTSFLLELIGEEMKYAEQAVRYLDKAYVLGRTTPKWAQWITTEEYLYVRSLFPEVSFEQKLSGDQKKTIRSYLCPKDERGLSGAILLKARRALTLENLVGKEGGIAFAKTCGLGAFPKSKMEKSAAADRASLEQYAVEHPSGGIYFPNAVMPLRGLLESELYAHTLLARMFEGTEISDGIRLWVMIQKETQDWGSDPAYIEALELVRDGSEELKKTSVVALKGEFEKPFGEIKESANGMSVTTDLKRTLSIGEKVTLKTEIRSEENRSFVRVSVPFPAGLIPVDQTSGYCRWRCYRSVLKDRIEYWFDVLPEEKTVLEEEFYAVREGIFQSPSAEAECLYADHYRANTAAAPLTTVE